MYDGDCISPLPTLASTKQEKLHQGMHAEAGAEFLAAAVSLVSACQGSSVDTVEY